MSDVKSPHFACGGPDFERRGKAAEPGILRFAFCILRLALLPMLAGCWLLGPDKTPPFCQIVQPTDSALVSGTVLVRAEATDTNGVTKVEFFADGSSIGVVSSEPFEAGWDTKSLPDSSWHRLWCTAQDPSGNTGYSDTVNVQVLPGGASDIFHGRFDLPSGYYWPVPFSAVLGDTVAGDFRVAGSGVVSRFIWMTAQNYQAFHAGQSYSALIEETNKTELSVRAGVASSDSFYLVFLNTSGSQITCWVRFSLE